MLKERGYRNWLRDFLEAMDTWNQEETITYWMRQGAKPKHEVQYVYLVIGNKVRFRANLVCYDGPCEVRFRRGNTMFARAWIVLTGPVVRPPHDIPMKGFRGFRYTKELF